MRARGTAPQYTEQQVEKAVTTLHTLHAILKAAQIAYATTHTQDTKQAQRDATIAYDNFNANNRSVLRVAFQAGIKLI